MNAKVKAFLALAGTKQMRSAHGQQYHSFKIPGSFIGWLGDDGHCVNIECKDPSWFGIAATEKLEMVWREILSAKRPA